MPSWPEERTEVWATSGKQVASFPLDRVLQTLNPYYIPSTLSPIDSRSLGRGRGHGFSGLRTLAVPAAVETPDVGAQIARKS